MHYGFIDESGGVAPFSGSRYLVVAHLRTAQPRALELHLQRMRKKYGKSLASGEMKASASAPDVIERFLEAIAAEEVWINAVIVDKRAITRPPTDPETIYHTAVGQAIYHALSVQPRLDVYLDRRYTTQRQRDALERAIREQISPLPQTVLLLRQEDSLRSKGLQVVDFVAWAFFQKYEQANDHFVRLLAHCIDAEEVIERQRW